MIRNDRYDPHADDKEGDDDHYGYIAHMHETKKIANHGARIDTGVDATLNVKVPVEIQVDDVHAKQTDDDHEPVHQYESQQDGHGQIDRLNAFVNKFNHLVWFPVE